MGDDEITAKRHTTCGQNPATIISRDTQHGGIEAIRQTAKNRQISSGAQYQGPGLARAIYRAFLSMRIYAGIAVARQINIPIYMQITIWIRGGIADNLHTRAQVELITISPQPGQLALHQGLIRQSLVAEGFTIQMLLTQVVLIDTLVAATIYRFIEAELRIVVLLESIDGNRPGPGNVECTACINIDIVARRATQARCVQSDSAVIRMGTSHTQIHAHAIGQNQTTLARINFNDSPVRCFNHLAVTVPTQHTGTGIQHGAASQGHPSLGSQANAARLLTAGINGAV